ncbi:MAG: glycosyltransferase family 4 protein [Colwellia sp.]|nr:glycosyltransferase family 4 protein [Colwellia sp.]
MSKLKVLICAPLPPPKGGIATWVDELVNANEQSNFADIYMFNTANKRKAGVYSNIKKIKDGLGLIAKQVIGFANVLKSNDVDLVHLSSSGGFAHFRDILFTLLSKCYGKKIVLQLHYGVNDNAYLWPPCAKLFLFILQRITDRVLVLDDSYVKSSPHKKLALSFNGITPNTTINISKKKKEIVFVGWIIKQKGVFDLIHSWNEILDKNDWQLTIIGPALKEEDKKLKQIINLGTTTYLGELSREEVIKRINNAKVFVLPSHTEGFPFAVLEAMERELALIVSNVGGMSQLFNEGNEPGWLIEPNDTKALKRVLETVTLNDSEVIKRAKTSRSILLNKFTSKNMLNNLIVSWNSAFDRKF